MAVQVLFSALHPVFYFRHGARLVECMFILAAAAVVTNYSYKVATSGVV